MAFDRQAFRYHINNPSAWDSYDERISGLMRAADNEIERLASENDQLRIDLMNKTALIEARNAND